MHLAGQFVRRILQGVVVVLITTFLIFSILRIVPGDPVRLIVGGMAPDNLVEEIAQKWVLETQFQSSLEDIYLKSLKVI